MIGFDLFNEPWPASGDAEAFSADTLPILGPIPDIPGLVLATGHSRKGILLGPLSGKLVAEQIADGKTSLPIDDYSPLRFAK